MLDDDARLLEINDTQRAVLSEALDDDRPAKGHHSTLRVLRDLRLIDDDAQVTNLGRYQIRWYADDCARAWGLVEAGTWHQYVKRGTAPPATARGTFGSSVDRPWWDPRTVLSFERKSSAWRKGEQTSALKDISEVDAQTIVRGFRGGTSARKLAALYGVAPTTLIAWLEERGEKPETTATRAERDRRMSANNPPTLPKRVMK